MSHIIILKARATCYMAKAHGRKAVRINNYLNLCLKRRNWGKA